MHHALISNWRRVAAPALAASMLLFTLGVLTGGAQVQPQLDSAALEQATTTAEIANSSALAGGLPVPPPKPCLDFFGSGRTSFATSRFSFPGGRRVFDLRNNGGPETSLVEFGLLFDFVTPGYYDADNITDIAVWRPGAASNTQASYIIRPSTAPTTYYGVQWGRYNTDNDENDPANDRSRNEADYDGDGRDDPTVVRVQGSNFVWYYIRSSNNTFAAIPFGNPATDVPLPGADYTGDGRAELSVVRTGDGGDYYLLGDSVTSAIVAGVQWGEFSSDFYVIGDYLGDRRADFAVWRGTPQVTDSTSGVWFIKENGGSNVQSYQWGIPNIANFGGGDLPVCGDYNGDGKQDVAVYRQSNATFYWINSGSASGGNAPSVGIQRSGEPRDFPVGLVKAR